ncbi:hypothetical protein B0H10DRAFT_1953936 [Mycena sp. CBHHK59/15]|nr:hypothetical protein B0H10DRAFT_1953936 [Mycena sp. CBHHK59/15]
MFKFNVQHDCRSAKCEASGERPRMKERVESDKTEKYIVHNPLDRFIINSHAFHNAHLLHANLKNLEWLPKPFIGSHLPIKLVKADEQQGPLPDMRTGSDQKRKLTLQPFAELRAEYKIEWSRLQSEDVARVKVYEKYANTLKNIKPKPTEIPVATVIRKHIEELLAEQNI